MYITSKNIPNYPNYHVTSDGRVFNIKTGKCLNLIPKEGYFRVGLSSNGKQSFYYVHRLVALACIPNPENLPCVMHLDDNGTNNDVSNLQWATHLENMKDRDFKGCQAKGERHGNFGNLGENHNRAKLSNVQREELISKHASVMHNCIDMVERIVKEQGL
ncbi:HNH endonuclease [Dysgonomonas sp.]